MRRIACILVTGTSFATLAGSAAAQEACRATTSRESAVEILTSAARAMGIPEGRLLVQHTRGRTVQDFQSDRSYPPFFSLMDDLEETYDPRDGTVRLDRSFVYPGMGPTPPARMIGTADASFMVRDSAMALPQLHGELQEQRVLNPWAVVQDWRRGGDVRVEGMCRYRDLDRIVLSREGPEGPQRLFIDPDSRFPVKQDWTVLHPTWGQRHLEALWSTWHAVEAGSYVPAASFLLADGSVQRERTVGTVRLVDPDAADAPTLEALPEAAPMKVDRMLRAWIGGAPDTVRVSDNAFVLAHPAYNEVVTLVGDTVVVLDATLGEERARADSAWIAQLFPGPHPVKVVVTDLAWPHIGGVRFWVARGATLVSHAASEDFLRALVERRWTLAPDALERARAAAPVPFRFQAVEDAASLGGGQVALAHIDGLGGEGALMAWLPASGFLWAGDFIQDLRQPTFYAAGVIEAARRQGFRPRRFAAQHVPLSDWSAVEAVNPTAGGGPR